MNVTIAGHLVSNNKAYRNKVIDNKSEMLTSDGRNEEYYKRTNIVEIIENKHKYPSDYIDSYFYGKKNIGERSNKVLEYGFHEIRFKVGKKLMGWREYNDYCIEAGFV